MKWASDNWKNKISPLLNILSRSFQNERDFVFKRLLKKPPKFRRLHYIIVNLHYTLIFAFWSALLHYP